VVLAAGPRIFDSSEPLRIPTLTGSTGPSWVGEHELIPDSDVTFGEIKHRSLARGSKALTKFRNEMAPGQLSTGVPLRRCAIVVQFGRAAFEVEDIKARGM
jgi:hypothetical protein